MKDKFDRAKQRIKDSTVPLAFGVVAGSVVTLVIAKKSNLFHEKHITWWTSISPDLIAETLKKEGHAVFDCACCDRTLTLVDQLHER